MKFLSFLTVLLFATLFLLPPSVFCQSDQAKGGSLNPPEEDAKAREDTEEPGREMPLLHGETAAFTYAAEPGFTGVVRIYPKDGSASYLVSENFLGLALQKSEAIDSQRLEKTLRNYPSMTQSLFENMMGQVYPDASLTSRKPFESQTFGNVDATYVQLEQDPRAEPYVRVKIETAHSGFLEFSVARNIVEALLAKRPSNDEEIIQGLMSIPFRLPERARQNFDRLSAAELAHLVENDPALQHHEFIRMRRVYERFPPQAAPQSESRPLKQAPHQLPPLTQDVERLASIGTSVQPSPPATRVDSRRTEIELPTSLTVTPKLHQFNASGTEPVDNSVSKSVAWRQWLPIFAILLAVLSLFLLIFLRFQGHS